MARETRVVKMSGAGNDFLVLGPEARASIGIEMGAWVRAVCRHGLSVGADGVLVVEPAGKDRVRVRFFNPDGSDAFCGNGSRCAARFAALQHMAGATMVLETAAGDVPAEVLEDQRVRLRLPEPRDLGLVALEAQGATLEGRRIHAGTPHYVCFVADPASAPLERWGPAVRHHPAFAPEGTNMNVARLSGSEVRLRTWEKGVDRETLACGSGAVAAAAAARALGAGPHLRVVPASGIPLEVEFAPDGGVMLLGDARLLLSGRIEPEALSAAFRG
jgi:diaminopimelate epimerase